MQTIWIDALEFDNFGGFVKDTQFVAEMGQGYLLADGAGTPVEPATVKFTVEEDGYYRFYIRTKNWCVGYEPDGLKLAVDGELYPHISGIMQINGWYFEVAADFNLTVGEHTLSVYDTTGWCGRFADVVITNDYDFTPSPELRVMKKQRAEIKGISTEPIIHKKYDLVVAGSGAAAVVSAISAARYGLKVALLSARPVLGGNGSDESKVSFDGASCQGFHETGIIYEIKCYTIAKNKTWSEAFRCFVEREANIDLFYDMCVIDATTENGSIKSALAQNTLDMTEHLFKAEYFIDATGDGWLGYYAGAKYRIGREAKFQHDESFAPEVADGNTMSGCDTRAIETLNDTICCYYATKEETEVPFTAPEWAFKLPEGDELGRNPDWLERGMWWLENRNDYDDLWEAEFARDAIIRIAVGYFDWMKNSWKDRDRAKNYKISLISTYLAKRESRRLIGDYIMTQNDFSGDAYFEDEVCYSGWRIDVHHVKGIFSGKDGAYATNQKVKPTPIPFRSLYSKNIDNLMFAGRCISVTHMALGTTRTQLTTATMGQAIGTAAYLCKKYGVNPCELDKTQIKELQQLLLKDDQTLINFCNNDKKDLALKAKISADSYIENGEPQNVISGKARQHKDEPYAWMSESKLPQSITFEFENEEKISQARITVKTPIDVPLYGFKPSPAFDGMITDLSVSVLCDGEWKTVATVEGNYSRLIVANFEAVFTKAVKITVNKALNFDKAIIPEIRFY